MIKILLLYFSLLLAFLVIIALAALRFRTRSSWPFVLIALLALLSFAPLFYGYWHYVYLNPAEEVVVPRVEGQKVGHALAALEDAGLKANISPYQNPEQTVQQQRPEGGMLVKKGRVIYLILADYAPPPPPPTEEVITDEPIPE